MSANIYLRMSTSWARIIFCKCPFGRHSSVQKSVLVVVLHVCSWKNVDLALANLLPITGHDSTAEADTLLLHSANLDPLLQVIGNVPSNNSKKVEGSIGVRKLG